MAVTRRRPAPDYALAYRLWREGLDDGQIAALLHCCRESVLRWRSKHRYRARGARGSRSALPFEATRLLQLRRQGMTWREVGAAMGRDPRTVQRWGRRLGEG